MELRIVFLSAADAAEALARVAGDASAFFWDGRSTLRVRAVVGRERKLLSAMREGHNAKEMHIE